MKNKIKYMVISVLVVGLLVGVIFGFGYLKAGYTRTVGKAQANADRETFKSTTAYTEQAALFLADSYQQYNEAKTQEDKKAIMDYVSVKYPNLDTDSIENAKLRNFYEQCISGGF